MFIFPHIEGHALAGCQFGFFDPNRPLPLVVMPQPGQEGQLLSLAAQHRAQLDALLAHYGAILFRGFKVTGAEAFDNFITEVSSEALFYSERSSPRHSIYRNIYTSTDHPADKEIVQHSEQSYNRSFPRRIFFYCQTPSTSGGQTPLADARRIYQRLSSELVRNFEERHYRYSRCFWQVMGTTWQTAFQTEDRGVLEEYCNRNDIRFQWQGGDVLKTYQVRRTTAYHPVTGEACWFNHCTFFNLLSLDEDTQEILRDSFEPDELPNQTFYGDGAAIEEAVVRELQAAYRDERVEFTWEQGDLLMIDNILVTHGRRSFQGERAILCGMSDVVNWEQVAERPAAMEEA